MHDIRNDKDIEKLVHAFYDKVRKNERLGYIFNDYAEVDWDKHLPRMVDFWSNILFQTGRYGGRPFRQHLPLPIEKMDFGRWYSLFEQTVNEFFKGEKAEYAKEMAGKIASSFSARMQMDENSTKENIMNNRKNFEDLTIDAAETVREACISAAREGFKDASMSGLCTEGAMEAAISAMQSLDLKKVLENLD